MGITLPTQPLVGLSLALLTVLPALAAPEQVQFETEDGVVIHARYHAPSGESKGATVYLHQPGRSGADWDYFAAKLAEKGIAGLAPDLRGHGGSVHTASGGDVDRELFVEADFQKMALDVAASVSYMRDERALAEGGLHLVGADVGGSAALLYAVEDTGVTTLALLSPGLMYDGVDTVGFVEAYGARPLLLVVSVEDSYATKSADVLNKEARGIHHLQSYYGKGHGTKMLNREPDLELMLGAWLLGTFKTTDGVSLAESMLQVQSQDRGGISTDELAEEQRQRAQQELEHEASNDPQRETVDDGDEPPGRWD